MRRTHKIKAIAVIAFLSLTPIGVAQNASKTSYIESWEKGSRKIQEQMLVIGLNTERPQYETIVEDASGITRYRLAIYYHPVKEKGPEHNWWHVDLSEIVDAAPSDNLLQKEGPGVGDNFPNEDRIGWLYPVEQPNIYKDVMGGYPFSAKRIIKVEGFYVIIKVTDYRFSPTNPRELDSLTVQIEFTNKYKGCMESRQASRAGIRPDGSRF